MTLESIDFGTRTLLAIVVGGLAYYMLGALWYMALFADKWVAATGRSKEEIRPAGAEMLYTLVGSILVTAALAFAFQWGGGTTVIDGAVVGLIFGVGIAATEGMKVAVYNVDERVQRWTLYGINTLYAVLGMMLAGVVYALIS